jgi:hypothetical protein
MTKGGFARRRIENGRSRRAPLAMNEYFSSKRLSAGGVNAAMDNNALVLTLLGIVVGVLVLVGLYTCAFEEAQRRKKHWPEE